jgi:hypothetical protein
MFSQFEGEALLADYVASRTDAIRGWAGLPVPPLEEASLPQVGTGPIESEDLLRRLTAYLLAGGDTAAPEFSQWLDFFVRKYETFKRLRRSYAANLTALDRTLVDKSCYALLGFVVAMATDLEDLGLLNALLKLNDHTLSAPVDQTWRGLVHRSVTQELSLVSGLARRLSVRLAEAPLC